jgi:asparagine synthase (glutamine-hydrolysing)
MAQCMRWTTPEALRERLPLLSPHADFVLVADARLDNREELIGALSLESAQARKITDGQLILQAYQTWGEACPGRLEGDFAFVVWDEQQKRLFCARDTAGVRPFYYYSSPKLFAFASEIKSLLRLPELQPGLNERKVADFLLWSFEDKTETYYQNIIRLPPAATLVVDEVVHEPRQYWSLDPHFELHMHGEDEYVQAFKEQFDRSVCNRMRSPYPVGSALSGGLDSSAIACIARQKMALMNELPLKVFSAVFTAESGAGVSDLDERDYIDSVLELGGFDHQYIPANQLSPLIDSQQLNEVLDEPFFSPTLFIFWGLFQSAHRQGVRVFLDGTDGDRTISFGTERLADLGRSGRWVALWKESSALAGNQSRDHSAARVMWKLSLIHI